MHMRLKVLCRGIILATHLAACQRLRRWRWSSGKNQPSDLYLHPQRCGGSAGGSACGSAGGSAGGSTCGSACGSHEARFMYVLIVLYSGIAMFVPSP